MVVVPLLLLLLLSLPSTQLAFCNNCPLRRSVLMNRRMRLRKPQLITSTGAMWRSLPSSTTIWLLSFWRMPRDLNLPTKQPLWTAPPALSIRTCRSVIVHSGSWYHIFGKSFCATILLFCDSGDHGIMFLVKCSASSY